MPTSYDNPNLGQEYIFYTSLVDTIDPSKFKSNPTLATGDVQVSLDGGAFTNLTTLPTVSPVSNHSVKTTLSSTEMSASNIVVSFIDATGTEWSDLSINIQPSTSLNGVFTIDAQNITGTLDGSQQVGSVVYSHGSNRPIVDASRSTLGPLLTDISG